MQTVAKSFRHVSTCLVSLLSMLSLLKMSSLFPQWSSTVADLSRHVCSFLASKIIIAWLTLLKVTHWPWPSPFNEGPGKKRLLYLPLLSSARWFRSVSTCGGIKRLPVIIPCNWPSCLGNWGRYKKEQHKKDNK